MILLCVRRGWADAARLPPVAENSLEPIDMLIGLAALLLLPGAILGIFDLVTGTIPTTQPAAGALPAPQERGGQLCRPGRRRDSDPPCWEGRVLRGGGRLGASGGGVAPATPDRCGPPTSSSGRCAMVCWS